MKRITLENFIEKAKNIHGDKYSYEKSKYINYDTKLEIFCPEHGSFWQTPGNHLKGKGCPFCVNRFVTTEDFIRKAREVHGDEYDYSKVVYVNNRTKICIIDKYGNEFWQKPYNHLSGYKCSYRSTNTNEFIIRANKVHGDKYDYSKTEYINANDKVCIICPEHGEFWQTPSNHLGGQGCPKCGVKKSHEKQKLTLSQFIEKAKGIHGDKYDYSKVEYTNNNTKVCIICPEHGEFWQTPDSHLSKHGCIICSGIMPLNTLKFIEKAKDAHGNKYDYSKVEYTNNHTKVCIICPEHGEFWQTPIGHLKGGCAKCGKKYRKKEKELYHKMKKEFKNEKIIHSYYNSKILGRQEIDIYFPEYKIGIEYQGEQHFKPVDFGGYGLERADILFKENIERDIKKNKTCKKNNIKLFYFSEKYDEFLDEKCFTNFEELKKEIEQVIKKENEK